MRKLKYAYYHLSRSIKCSFDGLLAAYKSEVAFRQDLVICSCLFVLALFWPVAFFYKMLMLLSLFFILFSELINTAIETTIDRISPEIHPLSKKAKDILKSYKDASNNAILRKDTKVTCQKIVKKNNSVWMKIPSGYICAINTDGSVYIK